MINLTLDIENHYEDSEPIKVTVDVEVAEPPPGYVPGVDNDDFEEWEQDEIFPHTGTGKEDGDSAYFVTVTKSSRPDLIPVGTEYEWGT